MKSENGCLRPLIINGTYMRLRASPCFMEKDGESPCKPKRHYAESIEHLSRKGFEPLPFVDFPSKEELKP